MTITAEPKIKPVAPRKTRSAKNAPGEPRPMTYEEYLATPEEMARYDIIDGVKKYRLYGEKKIGKSNTHSSTHTGQTLYTAQCF